MWPSHTQHLVLIGSDEPTSTLYTQSSPPPPGKCPLALRHHYNPLTDLSLTARLPSPAPPPAPSPLYPSPPSSPPSSPLSSPRPLPPTIRYLFQPRPDLLAVDVIMTDMPPTVLAVATPKAIKNLTKEQPGIRDYAKPITVRRNVVSCWCHLRARGGQVLCVSCDFGS